MNEDDNERASFLFQTHKILEEIQRCKDELLELLEAD